MAAVSSAKLGHENTEIFWLFGALLSYALVMPETDSVTSDGLPSALTKELSVMVPPPVYSTPFQMSPLLPNTAAPDIAAGRGTSSPPPLSNRKLTLRNG